LIIIRPYIRTLIIRTSLEVIIKVKSPGRSLRVNIVDIANKPRMILLIVPFYSLIKLQKAGKIRIRMIRIRIRII
jgi:hypothetical protein